MAELRTRPQSSRSSLRRRQQAKRAALRTRQNQERAKATLAERARRRVRQESRYANAIKRTGATDIVGAPGYSHDTATPPKGVLDDFLSGFKGPGVQPLPEDLEELEEEQQEEGGYERKERKDEREQQEEPDAADAPTVADDRTPEQRVEDAKADAATVLDERPVNERVQEARDVDAATVVDRPQVDPDAATVLNPDAATVLDQANAPTTQFDAADAPTVKPTQQAPGLNDGVKTDLAKPPVPEAAGKGAAQAGKKAAETGAKAAAEGAKGAAADVAGKTAKAAGKEAAGAAAKGAAKGAAKAAGKAAAKEGAKAGAKAAATAAGAAATGGAGLVAGAALDEGLEIAEKTASAAKKFAKGDVLGGLSDLKELGSEEAWRWIRRFSMVDVFSGIVSFTYAGFGLFIAMFQLTKTITMPKEAMKGGDHGKFLKGVVSFLEPPAIKPTNFEEMGETGVMALAGCVILGVIWGVASIVGVFFSASFLGLQELGEAFSVITDLFD